MPRTARTSVGGMIYHALNRSNGRVRLFNSDSDYVHFEGLLREAVALTGMRLLAYVIMPNHWHLVLHPVEDVDMPNCMHWLTTTHVRQYRAFTDTVGNGHLYQGSYKSFPVESDRYLLQLLRYVEQNPLRAGLVKRAEDWRWSSLWRRQNGTVQQRALLTEPPIALPIDYLALVNTTFDTETIDVMRTSVNKGAPFGSGAWVDEIVARYNLQSTLRGRGRPKRQ